MKRTTLAIIGCVVVGLMASTTQAREWTNKKGEKVDAEYVGVEGGNVKLRSNRDGNIYNIPIEMLSEADQMLIGDDLFSQKLRENPDKQELYLQRAHARMNRGDYQSSVRDFDYLIKLNPKNAEAYDGRGAAYSKMERPLVAHKDFEKAIELDAQLASAYRHRGENYKQLANTPEGKIMVDGKVEKYRQSYQAARREQLRSKGWQPLNSTSGNVSRYSAIGMLAKADYELAERIEAGYDVDKCGCGAGGVGIGGGYGVGKGVGVATGVGYGEVTADAPLAVYPAQVVQGETITLVANPSELAKGMPQKLGADGKPIRSAYGTSANAKMDVGNVNFYRDVNGNAELDIDADLKLGTDSDGSDGYSLEVSTAQFPPGPSRYFAAPEASESAGLSKEDLTTLAKNLDTAAKTEQKIAAQAASAGESSGLTAEQADQIQAENEKEVSEVASDAFKQLRTTLPEVADLVGEAAKPVKAVGNLMKAAGQKPGEESKEKAASAAEKAEAAAEQLAAAAEKLREMAESGELPKAQGKAVAAAGEILPKEGQVAQAPPGKPGPGAPGKPGPGTAGDDGDYGNDDDVVVIDEDDDDVVVLDDDDDVVVVRDHDDDDRVIVIDDDDYDRVVDDYDRVLVDDPDNVIVRRDRAGAYLTGGRYDYAVQDYNVLLQQQQLTVQQQIDFYYNRGCAHLAAGQLDNAIADFTASIQLKETGPLAYMAFNNRGIAYAKKGDYAKALAEFNSAIAINASDALAYKNRALAHRKLGKAADAEADMAKYSNLLGSL